MPDETTRGRPFGLGTGHAPRAGRPALDRRAPASVSRKSTCDGYSFSGSGAILLPCSTLLGAQFPSAAVPEIGPRTSLVSRFHVERSDSTMLSKILSPALVPWVSGGLAFLVAVGLTPIVRWGARRGGWVAIPEDEKWHDTPTTILGGIAIFLGGTVALIVLGNRHPSSSASPPPDNWGQPDRHEKRQPPAHPGYERRR